MRVLVTGARGQVGFELLRLAPAGFEVTGLSSAELDIADADQVAAAFALYRPQLVINAAAYTAVDRAESEVERAFAVNRDGVAYLARQAALLGAPVLHLSTDYVFAGDAGRPYRETDATAPASVYGTSKLAGEQALAEGCPQHMILRTSWVFGAHGSNFVKTMLRLGREREELSVVADQQGGPTPAADIARALWQLAEGYQSQGELPWGLYHFAGQPACSWHAFAESIFAEALTLGLLARVPHVRAIATADYPTPARRPAWSVLDCSKLQDACAIAQPDWRVGLRALLRELAQQG